MKRAPLSELSLRIVSASIPVSVSLEVSSGCNLDCVHCVRARREAELPSLRWLGLLDELSEMGTLELTFTGGEPTLRQDLSIIMGRASDKGFALSLFTNGFGVSTSLAGDLAAMKIRAVQMSLYGPDAGTHDSVTGVSGSFQRLMEAAGELAKRGIRTRAAIMVLSVNMFKLDETIDFARDNFAEFRYDFTLFQPDEQVRDIQDLRVPAAMALWLDDLMTNRKPDLSGVGKVFGEARSWVGKGCNMGRNTACVSASGQVYPCILFRRSAGSILERSFEDIWNSAAMDEMRRIGLRAGEHCGACPVRSYCHGCPGFSLSEYAADQKPSAEACRLFRARCSLV